MNMFKKTQTFFKKAIRLKNLNYIDPLSSGCTFYNNKTDRHLLWNHRSVKFHHCKCKINDDFFSNKNEYYSTYTLML